MPPTAPLALMTPPPTEHGAPYRPADFDTLADALDYAATACTGIAFHDTKGQLNAVLGYTDLQREAQACARRLLGAGLTRGDAVALIAETVPRFVVTFFACQYAGLIAVPLPVTVHLGGREAFVRTLARLVGHSRARMCLGTADYAGFIDEANLPGLLIAGDYAKLDVVTPSSAEPQPTRADEVAYVQFTSGSTRLPRGAVITARGVLRNVEAMLRFCVTPEDRFCSWLPLYHDMGLVGKLLAPVCGQASVDYLDSRVFAMRPRLWPALISRNGGTISYSPPFGYELCARRLRGDDAAGYRLNQWRIAGVGGEMIRADVLRRFADAFADSGFDARAFTPSYGMAEVGLGLSFAPQFTPLATDHVDRDRCADEGLAIPVSADAEHAREFVLCGRVLPGYTVEIRDDAGELRNEREVGEIYLRGPSIMRGYLDEDDATAAVLKNGWLDTGDLGYWLGDQLVLTGRRKDLIIVNGRNIWPQDLEFIAENEGVRTGSAAAFSVQREGGEEVVMVVECRNAEVDDEIALLKRIRTHVRAEFGVDCLLVAAEPRTLPRTTSGKLSRVRARQLYESGGIPDPGRR